MTEHEMRIRLAEAMGWTEIRDPLPPIWPGEDTTGMPPEGHRSRCRGAIPDPLDNDRDAALLWAWCVGREWDVSIRLRPTTAQEDGWHSVTITELTTCGGWREIGIGVAAPTDEPDPCRRERLALCRAVLQALDTVEAGGEA